MYFTNYLLFIYWFNNIIKDKINKDVLLININDSFENEIILIKKIKEIFESGKKYLDYEIFYIDKFDSLNRLKKTKKNANIIIFYSYFDINKFINLELSLLICNYNELLKCQSIINKKKGLVLDKDHIMFITDGDEELQIRKDEECENYIKKRDPIEVINTYNYIYISTLINSILKYFNNTETLKSNNMTPYYQWRDQIEKDILLLVLDKILTSRLAIALYRSSTLNFFESSTKIGKFYSNKFRIKSKTTLLHNKEKLKAYHLNKINI